MTLALITGATGMVGPRVVEAFAGAGFRVRTFSNDAAGGSPFLKGVEVCTGDIADPAAVQRVVAGADVVVHLAALLHVTDPPLGMRDAYERANVQGTRVVVDAARQVGVRRLVFFSTIAVYGEVADRVLGEDAPVRPETLYAQTKAEAERIVLGSRREDGGQLGVVLRLGAVYGARVKGNYRRMVEALARRRFVPIGSGRNRRAMVYDRDVASAAMLAATRPVAGGRIYNVSDGERHTLAEIIQAICDALGRRPPGWHLPILPVRAGVGLVEGVARLLGKRPPVSGAMIEKYTGDVVVDSRRISDELGFAPRYDLRTGWREAIAGMRKAGELEDR